MHYKLPTIFCLLVLTSCLTEDSHRINRWELDSFVGTPICSFTIDPIEKNTLVETFLGFHDTTYFQTTLLLLANGEFHIIKNDNLCIAGTWELTKSDLRLDTKLDRWILRIVKQNERSLILQADAYPYMVDVEIVLKH